MEELDELYITKKQVVQIVSDYLEPLMSEKGYKFIKSKDAFIKKTNFGLLMISINCKSFWPLKQEVNISIAVINYEINNIRKQFFNNVNRDDFITHDWLVLPNSNELSYKELFTENDIEIAKQESYDLIKQEAFIYLEKYSHLENIIEYSKNIKNAHYMSYLLISTKLTNDIRYINFKDEIIKYIQSKDFEYEGVETDLKSLYSLINYLDNL